MSFDIDDVMEAIQIVKQCKDTSLYIETGDLKLSIAKGKVVGIPVEASELSGPACISKPTESKSAPIPTTPEPVVEASIEQNSQTSVPVESPTEKIIEDGLMPIKATVTSVFYRKPSPEEPPFVEVGDTVQEDTVVCLLEVMKCFRQVTAEVSGTIAKICVESGNMVEQGTALFLIKPT